MKASAARVLVFDSGLGGLTVLSEIARARPEAEIVYAADDAFFPYGALSEAALVARVGEVVATLIERFAPDLVVVACNTASTLVLAPLRAAHPGVAFVGTVPAIKPAAPASRSGLISVLATPGTVARDYTRGLVRDFAGECEVTLVGSARLAEAAERRLRGEAIEAEEIAREIAPCFVSRGDRRTDHVVLACTHFPSIRLRRSRAGSTRCWVRLAQPGRERRRFRSSSPAAARRRPRCEGFCIASGWRRHRNPQFPSPFSRQGRIPFSGESTEPKSLGAPPEARFPQSTVQPDRRRFSSIGGRPEGGSSSRSAAIKCSTNARADGLAALPPA
jgi:glutamate racemase